MLSSTSKVYVFDDVDSTQNVVKAAFSEGAKEGYAVRAKRQSSGRGRYSRVWQGGEGNFLFSVLLRPRADLSQASQISFVAVNSVYDAVVEFAGEDVGEDLKIKWPNDLLLSGKKLSGILLEVENDKDGYGIVLGVGVNLVQAPEEGISLKSRFDGLDCNADRFTEIFMKQLAKNYQQWQDYGFETVRERWIERSGAIGQNVLVRLADEEFSGTVSDFDKDGALVLVSDVDQTTRRITAGDVFYQPS